MYLASKCQLSKIIQVRFIYEEKKNGIRELPGEDWTPLRAKHFLQTSSGHPHKSCWNEDSTRELELSPTGEKLARTTSWKKSPSTVSVPKGHSWPHFVSEDRELKYYLFSWIIFCSFMKFNRIKITTAHYPLPVGSTWAEVMGKDRKCCYRCLIEESPFWNVFAWLIKNSYS